MKKIGVTGTRIGMSEDQKVALLLFDLENDFTGNDLELHHGDCFGVDIAMASMFKSFGLKTILHPPLNNQYRAFHESDEVREAKDYLVRNKDIVNECDVLLVFPKEMEEVQRSGTWSTYRYAKKKNKPIVLILPDGSIKEENYD
jgi:hypothetical protein